MSKSPKVSQVQRQAEERRRAEEERRAREAERERRRRAEEVAALARARAEAGQRAARLKDEIVAFEADRAALGQTGASLVGEATRAAGAGLAGQAEIAVLRGDLDRLSAALDIERTNAARTAARFATQRLHELAATVRALPIADRLAHDRDAVAGITELLKKLNEVGRGSDVAAAAALLREAGPRIDEHVRRVRAGVSDRATARLDAESRLAGLRAELQALQEDADAVQAPFDAGAGLREQLDAADALVARGRTAPLADLRERLTAAAAELDEQVDRRTANRRLMAAIVEQLPGLGLRVLGSFDEEADGTITVRAATGADEGLGVTVTATEAGGQAIMYRSQRIEQLGPGGGACSDVVGIGTRLGARLGEHGFEVGQVEWEHGPGEYGRELVSG